MYNVFSNFVPFIVCTNHIHGKRMKSRILIISLVWLLLTACQLHVNAQRIAIIGDSNTWLGGDDNKGEKGWNHWFCEYFKPDFCRSFARSGATWTNTPRTKLNIKENIGSLGDNNVAYNQLQRMLADKALKPDIIIIALGTNDLWFKNKRPNLFDESHLNYEREDFLSTPPSKLLTLADCVHHTVHTLRKAYPNAAIVLITPAECIHIKNYELKLFSDTLEALGKTLGASTIRLDKLSEIKSEKERIKKEFTYDGTHTSVKGAKANGEIITRELKRILQCDFVNS